MDILLGHAYFLDDDPHERAVMKPYPPLGLLYVSSHLKAAGFSVGLFDSTFATLADFEQLVERERPPVVGLYVNLMTRRSALAMIRAAKRVNATVILGGPEPAGWAEEYLARGADLVVIGEGEEALTELLPHLARYGLTGLAAINGLAFRDDDGTVVRTAARASIQRIDEQPEPDRSAIDLRRYLSVWREHHGAGAVSMITARGCPYRCRWCSHSVFGYTHRRRSIGRVADELAGVVETYQPEQVWYADDVFTIHHRWLFGYAEELRRRGIRVPFETISREDRLNEPVVQTLAEMGCQRLWIGAESGSQKILDAMARRTNAERVVDQVRLLHRYGIEVGMFIMLGYEGENESDLEASVHLLKEAKPDIFLTTVAYPINGTPYHDDVSDRIVTDRPWEERTDRDVAIAGRHSRRYYSFATRWLVNDVALSRERAAARPNPLRIGKAFANVQVGRFGMRLTAREVEG